MKDFYKNKNILITGNTGFMGSWLCLNLLQFGSKVYGYSLPNKEPNHIFHLTDLANKVSTVTADVCNLESVKKALHNIEPDIIFYLAAQSLVIDSYHDPIETIRTNDLGLTTFLYGLKEINKKCTVVVSTSDKCYQPTERSSFFKEQDALGGNDFYSVSKAAQEMICKAFYINYFANSSIHLATVRCGNIIGGGDYSNNRLLPDCVRSIVNDTPLILRNPRATRPWQHVLEAISGLLQVAIHSHQQSNEFNNWNIGPDITHNYDNESVVNLFFKKWGMGSYKTIENNLNVAESKYLNLDNGKAKKILNWKPRFSLDQAIELTASWYKLSLLTQTQKNMTELSYNQINHFYNQS